MAHPRVVTLTIVHVPLQLPHVPICRWTIAGLYPDESPCAACVVRLDAHDGSADVSAVGRAVEKPEAGNLVVGSVDAARAGVCAIVDMDFCSRECGKCGSEYLDWLQVESSC